MKGLIIENNFNDSNSFKVLINDLKRSFLNLNCKITVKTNADILYKLYDSNTYLDYDFVLFWDKDILLCEFLEKKGLRVFNSSKSIFLCDDKFLTAKKLFENGIPIPKTILVPKSFFNVDYTNQSFIDEVIKDLGIPLIIKETHGSFGLQVHLCNTKKEIFETLNTIGFTPAIFQEFIKGSFGTDLRLYVVNGSVVASMKRVNELGDFRANFSKGTKTYKYTPTSLEKKIAIDSCRVLGLDFGGVDLLLGENSNPVVCEVNSNAHFKKLDMTSNVCIGNNIAQYILKTVKKN